MIIINAEDTIVGRLGTVVAKKALLGQDIAIVNADKAVISGTKATTLKKYKTQNERGEPFHGPFLPKRPDMLLKRMIRGMLPRGTARGRDALKRIKCYMGVPKAFEDKNIATLDECNAEKLPNFKYITVGKLAAELKG